MKLYESIFKLTFWGERGKKKGGKAENSHNVSLTAHARSPIPLAWSLPIQSASFPKGRVWFRGEQGNLVRPTGDSRGRDKTTKHSCVYYLSLCDR